MWSIFADRRAGIAIMALRPEEMRTCPPDFAYWASQPHSRALLAGHQRQANRHPPDEIADNLVCAADAITCEIGARLTAPNAVSAGRDDPSTSSIKVQLQASPSLPPEITSCIRRSPRPRHRRPGPDGGPSGVPVLIHKRLAIKDAMQIRYNTLSKLGSWQW